MVDDTVWLVKMEFLIFLPSKFQTSSWWVNEWNHSFFFPGTRSIADALIMHKLESCMILSCPSHGQCPLWARHAAVLAARLNPVLMTNVWNNSVGPLNHQLSSAAISISITTTTTTGSRPFKVTPWMSRVAVPTSSDVTPPVSRDHRRRRRQGGDLLGASSSSSSCCW